MVAILLAATLLTGDGAIARADQVLQAFEVPPPYHLTFLLGPPPSGVNPLDLFTIWNVGVRAAGHAYRVDFDAVGRLLIVRRDDANGLHNLHPQPGDEARAEKWLAYLSPLFPVVFAPDPATGEIAFTNPATHLGYRFDLLNGQLVSFYAQEKHHRPSGLVAIF